MPASLKAVVHSAISLLIMWLPLANFSWLNLTIGGVIMIVANYILSATVATTTGASARQR